MSDRTPPGIQRRPVNKRAWIAFAILAVLVVVGIGAYAGSMSRPALYDPNNSREAISQCEARVQDQLKAPATATFDSEATGYGTWTVTGVVDSENSFGAVVRSEYQCTVRVDGPDAITTRIDFLE